MVDYNEVSLIRGKLYSVIPVYPEDKEQCIRRWKRTIVNLDKMMRDGRPIVIVSPIESLSDSQIEEYRKFFCKEAKRNQCNYVYFPCPVMVKDL